MHAILPHSLLTVSLDIDGLGRCNPSMLPQQALLELLIQDIKYKERFQDDSGAFLDICDWVGLSTDEDGQVYRIMWTRSTFNYADLERIDFRWLPPSLLFLHISGNSTLGSLETCDLPRSLCFIRLRENKLYGTLNLRTLPPDMRLCDVGFNQFTGSLDLGQLPKGLETLFLTSNEFSESIDLTNLPSTLSKINLAKNKLSGNLDLSQLPEKIARVLLQGNEFSGYVNCTNMPESLQVLRLDSSKVKLEGSNEDVLRVLKMCKSIDMRFVD